MDCCLEPPSYLILHWDLAWEPREMNGLQCPRLPEGDDEGKTTLHQILCSVVWPLQTHEASLGEVGAGAVSSPKTDIA